MPAKTFLSLFFTSIILTSCKFECSMGGGANSGKPSTGVSSPKAVNGVILGNNITLDAKGIRVKSATLRLENGSRVSDDNVVALGEKVNLVLIFDTTWTVQDGKSFIGMSEKISTDKGEQVLYAADLFAEHSQTGIDPTDAKVLSLSAHITEDFPGTTHYKVDFKAWDKKGDAEVSGSYKFYIKKD